MNNYFKGPAQTALALAITLMFQACSEVDQAQVLKISKGQTVAQFDELGGSANPTESECVTFVPGWGVAPERNESNASTCYVQKLLNAVPRSIATSPHHYYNGLALVATNEGTTQIWGNEPEFPLLAGGVSSLSARELYLSGNSKSLEPIIVNSVLFIHIRKFDKTGVSTQVDDAYLALGDADKEDVARAFSPGLNIQFISSNFSGSTSLGAINLSEHYNFEFESERTCYTLPSGQHCQVRALFTYALGLSVMTRANQAQELSNIYLIQK